MLQTQPDSVYGSNFLGQRAWEEVVARLASKRISVIYDGYALNPIGLATNADSLQDLRLYDGHIALKAGKTTLSRAR